MKVTLKKANVVVTKEDVKKVKGPPTNRKAPPSPEAYFNSIVDNFIFTVHCGKR